MADLLPIGIDSLTGQTKTLDMQSDSISVGRSLFILSPDDSTWEITVNDLGIISTTKLT